MRDVLIIRPGRYEEAPAGMRVALDRVLGPIGVRRVTATVTWIATEAHTVRAVARTGEEPDATRQDITVSDGDVVPGANVVWTARYGGEPLTIQITGARDRLGRLSVDEYLRVVAVPDVHAAGGAARATADGGRTTAQSCRHALPMGRFAVRSPPCSFWPRRAASPTADSRARARDPRCAGTVRALRTGELGWDGRVKPARVPPASGGTARR